MRLLTIAEPKAIIVPRSQMLTKCNPTSQLTISAMQFGSQTIHTPGVNTSFDIILSSCSIECSITRQGSDLEPWPPYLPTYESWPWFLPGALT